MTVEIIVEDGSGVANANSYTDVDGARVYATNRGVTLPSNDDDVAVMLIKGNDYIQAQEAKFQGVRTFATQPLAFPRTGVMMYGVAVPSDVIPNSLVSAQIELALAVNAGFDLQPNVTAQDYVTMEKVGPIETEYADPISVGIDTSFGAAESLLGPLYDQSSSKLKTIRV